MMQREQELIKEIDNHIKKAGGFYGLELPDSDLRVIRKALNYRVAKEPENKEIEFGDLTLCCPTCRKPVINYYTPKHKPACCQFCGQVLDRREK